MVPQEGYCEAIIPRPEINLVLYHGVLAPLAQGSHTFSVKAQDAAGNQSAAASFT